MTSILVIAKNKLLPDSEKNTLKFQYNIAKHLEDFISSEHYGIFIQQQVDFFRSIGELRMDGVKYSIVSVMGIRDDEKPFEGNRFV